MKKFQTVYDFHHAATMSVFAYLPLAFAIICGCVFFYNRRYGDRDTFTFWGTYLRRKNMLIGAVFGLGALAVFIVLLCTAISTYHTEKNYFDSGKYKIVEGKVENFHPMPAGGHDSEHFDVNSVHFDYGSAEVAMGYNDTRVNGGVIHQGLYVRLLYVTNDNNNAILKIDTLLH